MKKNLIFLGISLALFSSTANADLIIKKDNEKTIQIINGKEVIVENKLQQEKTVDVDVQTVQKSEVKVEKTYHVDESRPNWREWKGPSNSRTLYQAQKPVEQVTSPHVEVKTDIKTKENLIIHPEKTEIKVDLPKEEKVVTHTTVKTTSYNYDVIDNVDSSKNLDMVTTHGQRPLELKKAGWGSQVSSYDAIMQIIPKEFNVDYNNINPDVEVSWGGNKDWDKTLADIASQGDFFAHIDWSGKNVVIAGNYFNKESTVKNSDSDLLSERVKEEVISERKIETTVVVPDAISKDVKAGSGAAQVIQAPLKETAPNSWYLDPSFSLRENVMKWGERAGWTVVWEGADYPIVSRAYFTGVFESPDGPLAQIIQAFETSDQPLVASLTTLDKVVHVRNRIHERAHVVPTTPHTFNPHVRD